jgi:hypothetical protein
MSKLDNVVDLSQLPSVSDDLIVACLRERFLRDAVYTRVGSSAIVAVNPHKYVASSADPVLVSYAQEHRDTSATKIYKEPHIFQLANNAYYNMRRTGQDQCILLMSVSFPCPARPAFLAPLWAQACGPSLFRSKGSICVAVYNHAPPSRVPCRSRVAAESQPCID